MTRMVEGRLKSMVALVRARQAKLDPRTLRGRCPILLRGALWIAAQTYSGVRATLLGWAESQIETAFT